MTNNNLNTNNNTNEINSMSSKSIEESFKIDQTLKILDQQFDNFGALVNSTQHSFLLETAKISSMLSHDTNDTNNIDRNEIVISSDGIEYTDEIISMLTLSPRLDKKNFENKMDEFQISNSITPRRSARIKKAITTASKNHKTPYSTNMGSYTLSEQKKEIPRHIMFEANSHMSPILDTTSNNDIKVNQSSFEQLNLLEKINALDHELNNSSLSDNVKNVSIDDDMFLPNERKSKYSFSNLSKTNSNNSKKNLRKSISVLKKDSSMQLSRKKSVGSKPPLATKRNDDLKQGMKQVLTRSNRKSLLRTDNHQNTVTKSETNSSVSKSSPASKKSDGKVNRSRSTSSGRQSMNTSMELLNEKSGPNTDSIRFQQERAKERVDKISISRSSTPVNLSRCDDVKDDEHVMNSMTKKTPEERAQERAERAEKLKKAKEAAKIEKAEHTEKLRKAMNDVPNNDDNTDVNIVTKKSPEERARERAERLEKIKQAREERRKSVINTKESKDKLEPKAHVKVKLPEERARERVEHAEMIKRKMEAKRKRWKEPQSADSNRQLTRPSSRPSSARSCILKTNNTVQKENINNLSEKVATKTDVSVFHRLASRKSSTPLGRHSSNDSSKDRSSSRGTFCDPSTDNASKPHDRSTSSFTVPRTPNLCTLKRLGERRYSSRGRHGRNPDDESNPITAACGSPTHGLIASSSLPSSPNVDAQSPRQIRPSSRQRSSHGPLESTKSNPPKLQTLARLGERTYSMNRKNKVPDKIDTLDISNMRPQTARSASNPRTSRQNIAQAPQRRSVSIPKKLPKSNTEDLINRRSTFNPRDVIESSKTGVMGIPMVPTRGKTVHKLFRLTHDVKDDESKIMTANT